MPRAKSSTKTKSPTKKTPTKKTPTNKISTKKPIRKPTKTQIKKVAKKAKKKIIPTPKPANSDSILRILCFSNFNKDPKSLLTYLNEFNSQTYPNIDFILNIRTESKSEHRIYREIISNYIPKNSIKIVFQNKYNDQTSDDLYLLEHVAKEKYNTFIYCNPDFNYNPNHIQNLVDIYKDKPCDVLCVSCDKIIDSAFNMEKSYEKKYNFIYNNKAMDIIFSSPVRSKNEWMNVWAEHKIKVRELGHISTLFLIEKEETQDVNINTDGAYYKSIDNENFALCVFEHNYWSSFVYLNKRNNRMYNIDNDDHGAFEIKDNDTINITWDTWGDEIFYKKYDNDNYFYSINE